MKRKATTVLTEALIFGTMTMIVSTGLVYVFSKGELPKKENAKIFLGASFLSGALLHLGFEITGGNEKFSRNFIEQISEK